MSETFFKKGKNKNLHSDRQKSDKTLRKTFSLYPEHSEQIQAITREFSPLTRRKLTESAIVRIAISNLFKSMDDFEDDQLELLIAKNQ